MPPLPLEKPLNSLLNISPHLSLPTCLSSPFTNQPTYLLLALDPGNFPSSRDYCKLKKEKRKLDEKKRGSGITKRKRGKEVGDIS